MSIDYEQLKDFVKEAMFTGGGINEPSAPEGVPHRMPSADTQDKEQDMGDPEANEMYDVALAAREATEKLVVALDDPAFDRAYEFAFKASACLRNVLNSIEQDGAHPMPDQRVVAPPPYMQKYTGAGSGVGDLAGGFAAAGLYEASEEDVDLSGTLSRSMQAQGEKERARAIGRGDVLGGVDNRERAILVDVEKLLTQVADKDDLVKYRPMLQAFLKRVMKLSAGGPEQETDELEL
mgnify:CR=1 FL=1